MTMFIIQKTAFLSRKQRVVLAGIFIAGFLLRVAWLDKQSLWLDEMTSILVSQAPLMDILQGRVFDNHTPPLYYVLLKLWGVFAPLDEIGLRLFSALVDAGSLFLFWLLGRRLFAPPRALLAVAAYAFSPFLIYYAQEGRMYSLMVFWVLGYSLLFLRMLSSEGRACYWVFATGIVLALGVYTHYYFAFFAVGLNFLGACLYLRTPRRLWGIFVAGAVGVVLFIPWLHIVAQLTHTEGQSFREFVFLVLPYSVFRFVVGYAVFPLNLGTKVDYMGEIIRNLPSIIVVFGIIAFMVKDALLGKNLEERRLAVSLAWLGLAPALIAILVSIKFSLISERYLLVGMPFFILLLFSQVHLTGRKVVPALFFALLAWGDFAYFFSPDFGKAQWRDAASFVAQTASDSDLIVTDPSYAMPILEYYLKRDADGSRLLGNLVPAGSVQPGSPVFGEPEGVILISSGYKIGSGADLTLGRYRKLKETKVFPLETGIVVSSWGKKFGSVKK